MDERFMRMAIEKAREGVAQGGSPFGACIVRDGEVVACAHNRVWQETDITAHAEIVAIREACRKLGTIDLSGCEIYSTCEPCPMCFAACHWARLDRVIFGARIADAAACGFNELHLSNREMKEKGGSPVEITGDFLRDECVELFRSWRGKEEGRTY
ncbi:MAG TPA: nucleoside deaminase [Armatimonadota bacterium]|nr:nucleoside deaminase [Armatimonadota bacterium]